MLVLSASTSFLDRGASRKLYSGFERASRVVTDLSSRRIDGGEGGGGTEAGLGRSSGVPSMTSPAAARRPASSSGQISQQAVGSGSSYQ
ncbi:hypothetical protein KUCAC02_037063, partial [Chaenocephalus aceratus]